MAQGGHAGVPLSAAHKLVAFIPYLGKDFGMAAWLRLQAEALPIACYSRLPSISTSHNLPHPHTKVISIVFFPLSFSIGLLLLRGRRSIPTPREWRVTCSVGFNPQAQGRARIRLRGREQERRVAARSRAGAAALQEAGEQMLIRRLTIFSSYGPLELVRWYKRMRRSRKLVVSRSQNVEGGTQGIGRGRRKRVEGGRHKGGRWKIEGRRWKMEGRR